MSFIMKRYTILILESNKYIYLISRIEGLNHKSIESVKNYVMPKAILKNYKKTMK